MARNTSFVPTIMIVDDEPLIRMHARQIVEQAGYSAVEAADADHALELLSDDGVSVVVTDVQMPGSMDGLELAHAVKAAWPSIVIVVMSGRHLPLPADLPEGTRFLSKPFSEQRLVDVLADALYQDAGALHNH
jgi:two-component system, response regulator PdtaR